MNIKRVMIISILTLKISIEIRPETVRKRNRIFKTEYFTILNFLILYIRLEIYIDVRIYFDRFCNLNFFNIIF